MNQNFSASSAVYFLCVCVLPIAQRKRRLNSADPQTRNLHATTGFVRKCCAPLPRIFFRPRSKWPRPQSYTEESQTESTLHRQAGIVRRLARRRTIQLVGTLCVNACSVVCVKSMILACGFVFGHNPTRVPPEAPRRLGRGTRSSRFFHSTFEHGGPENCCRSKPKLGSGYAL